ncbi:phosphotransferase system, EIIB [Cardiobacterium valvarum F0432]|uniref:Phosphotransferase system, EIIB n=1 Tax=Cardiobacterium valvarum F0432 TaxID=797473 RepID=G9ZBA2_9GAMM|nr:phosphotransferase system, EIIB [Cardiobacterium valvarum F0432]
MSRFQQDAALLLDAIGGKDNINAITHCVTRLRFVLKDPKRADVSRIESVASVKGTFTQSGQFQVIIGNEDGRVLQSIHRAGRHRRRLERCGESRSQQPAEPVAAHHERPRRNLRADHPRAHLRRSHPRLPQPHRRNQNVRRTDAGADLRLLGGDVPVPLAHRRSRLPYASHRHRLVDYPQNGHHPHPRHRPRRDARLAATAERLCCCGHRPGGYPAVGFRLRPRQHDRLPGTSHCRHHGGLRAGLSRTPLPPHHPGCYLHDRRALLLAGAGGHHRPRPRRPDRLENRFRHRRYRL